MLLPFKQRADAELGLYLFVAGTISASSMGICAKLAGNRGIPVFEIVLARSVVLLALTLPQLAHQRINPLRSERKALLLLRGVLGLGAVSTLYWSVQLLPLADAAVLNFLAPVFVAALAPLALHELPSRDVLLAIALAVLGVVLVAQPNFVFGGQEPLSTLGVAVGMMQAVFSAAAKVCIRALGSTEPVQSIVASMAAVSTLGSALLCAVLPHHFVRPTGAATWLLLVAVGLLGFGNQYLTTTALKLSSAAPAVAMSYVAVLWSILADLVIFHDAPGLLSLAGAAVVCTSSYLVVRSQQQRGGTAAAAGSGESKGGSKKHASNNRSEEDEERVELIEAGGHQQEGEKAAQHGTGSKGFVTAASAPALLRLGNSQDSK